MNKKWKCYEENNELAEKIESRFSVSKLLAKILVNKGLVEEEKIKVFLNPTRSDFHDPYLMPDMSIAVDRISKAIEEKEKIIIYGDYDVDGITSITVLKKFLQDRGVDVDCYIPNRLEEGYGLNKNAINKIFENGYNLMITVDCGISGIEEIDYANSLGLEIIVTDHHEQGEFLPKALAIVDAKRKDNKYPFNQLAGVGVVFKVIQALGIKYGLDEKEYLKYLDLVCVGTISDIVPLIDENRVIAKLGLKLVEMTQNIGLKTLLKDVGYKKVDSTTVSFGIAPRINACGRMGHEQEALQLFLTDNILEAQKISEKLNEYNRARQETEKKIFEQALKIVEKEEKNKPCIILGNDEWHHGVIGIVASKVTEMYFKPSILICFEGEDGKGSGRSIPGFDLHDALSKCGEYIDKFGGHSMAVGISVKKEDFENFKNEFQKYTASTDIHSILPIVNIDEEITLKDFNLSAVNDLKYLEPFGEGNKMPIFMYKNLKINSIRALSEGKHLKLTLKDDNFIMEAIGFNLGHLSTEYKIGDKIDVAGSLEINSFNSRETVQINLKDIRKSY
ncbi:MAG TPA: single-stranded-DNA-specific exonuclease RecJ [Clostridia bacterium]|nr:single-stranded-DNA-specific exonuclease RecJ [Clostridia bacterium]